MLILNLPSCAGGAEKSGAVWSGVADREWLLAEIRAAEGVTVIDRAKNAVPVDNYTIKFDGERAAGRAAPNRYFTPYTAGENGALSIGLPAGTMMAPLVEPQGLKESDYFLFLGRVSRWDFREGKLELYTSSKDGAEAVMVFLPKQAEPKQPRLHRGLC